MVTSSANASLYLAEPLSHSYQIQPTFMQKEYKRTPLFKRVSSHNCRVKRLQTLHNSIKAISSSFFLKRYKRIFILILYKRCKQTVVLVHFVLLLEKSSLLKPYLDKGINAFKIKLKHETACMHNIIIKSINKYNTQIDL